MLNRELIPIGSKASCVTHKGTLIAYFTAKADSRFMDQDLSSTELYGVLDLDDNGYWTEDRGTFIRFLVVHVNNLDRVED